MMDHSFSGRSAMASKPRLAILLLLLQSLLLVAGAFAAEAPAVSDGGVSGMPEPLGPEGEAAYQDQRPGEPGELQLDEAVFTEILPITVPELAIKLPADQEH